MIFQTRFNKYVDENNVEVSEAEKMLYLQEGGTIDFTDFNLPEDVVLLNAIHFMDIDGTSFGTESSPRTGPLTFNLVSSVPHAVSIVYYQNATLDMPNVWMVLGTFLPNQINKLYMELDSEMNITVNIVNFGLPTNPSATAPTITVADPVFDPNAPSATAPTITVTNP
jgi:hypothetical protein